VATSTPSTTAKVPAEIQIGRSPNRDGSV
jgi:hypothetical protein